MCATLKNQLEWINENLNTIVQNQAMIYRELKELRIKIDERKNYNETDTKEEKTHFSP